MKYIKKFNKTHAVDASNLVAKLSEPLFAHSTITAFGYISYQHNGQLKYLCNDADWLDYFYQHQLQRKLNQTELPEVFRENYVLGEHVANKKIVEAAKKFDYHHSFAINQVSKDKNEIYIFASYYENIDIVNWYVNNLELLSNFCCYFKENADEVINTIKPINAEQLIKQETQSDLILQSKKKEHILNEIRLKKWRHQDILYNEHLTQKEIQCLFYTLQGKTANDIAEMLHRSRRTIEGHLKNIKRKLNCQTKSELITKISKTNFLDAFNGSYP